MSKYECSICHGNVDAGELVNGVCYECRMEMEKSKPKIIKDEFDEVTNTKASDES